MRPSTRVKRRFWTPEDDALLKRLRSEGNTWKTTAATLNTSTSAAKNRMYHHIRYQPSPSESERAAPPTSVSAGKTRSNPFAHSGVRTIWTASQEFSLSKRRCVVPGIGRKMYSTASETSKLSPIKRWSQEEIEQLLRYRELGLTFPHCAELLQRTVRSVQDKFHSIKSSSEAPRSPIVGEWSRAEIEQLLRYREQGLTFPHCAELLQRPRTSVQAKFHSIKSSSEASRSPIKPEWSRAEIEQLLRYREQGLTLSQCAKLLKRSYSAVVAKSRNNHDGVPRPGPHKTWSDEEVEQLHRGRAQGMSFRQCAVALQRTMQSVESKYSLTSTKKEKVAARLQAKLRPEDKATLVQLREKQTPWHEIRLQLPRYARGTLMSAWHTHVNLLEAVPKPRQWHQWSSEDVRLLTESRQAGMKFQDIAHKMERPILSIEIKMHRLKLTQPKHRWTTEEDNKLLLLHSKGLSWPIIGEMLGRSRSACCNHYHDIPKNQTQLPARETDKSLTTALSDTESAKENAPPPEAHPQATEL